MKKGMKMMKKSQRRYLKDKGRRMAKKMKKKIQTKGKNRRKIKQKGLKRKKIMFGSIWKENIKIDL